MEDIFCESRYGGEGYENWRAQHREEEDDNEGANGGRSAQEIMESMPEYEKLMALWADIIEKGANWDPAALTARRQQMKDALAALGLVDSEGNCDMDKLWDFSVLVARHKERPIKKDDYPDKESFLKGARSARKENPELFDNLEGRDGKEIGDYLYGLGIVMDTQIVYENIFANDPIVLGINGQVENGRHRTAVLESFYKCGYIRRRPWVKTTKERI